MIIASNSGRLLPADTEIKGSFRWMGSRCCVVQAWGSSRRRNEGGSTPRSLARGRKRRGTRSRRSGVRKRRALVGEAPEPTPPASTHTRSSTRSIKRRERCFEYSFRHIFFAEDKLEAMERLQNQYDVNHVHRDGRTTLAIVWEIHRSIVRHLQKWRQIRKATHPGEPSFSVSMALEGVLGVDVRRHLGLSTLKLLTPAGSGVIAESVDIPVPVKEQKKAIAGGQLYWCGKCLTTARVRVCRRCGGSLAKSNHEKRVGERKPMFGPGNQPTGSKSTRLVTSPPTRTPPKGKGSTGPRR